MCLGNAAANGDDSGIAALWKRAISTPGPAAPSICSHGARRRAAPRQSWRPRSGGLADPRCDPPCSSTETQYGCRDHVRLRQPLETSGGSIRNRRRVTGLLIPRRLDGQRTPLFGTTLSNGPQRKPETVFKPSGWPDPVPRSGIGSDKDACAVRRPIEQMAAEAVELSLPMSGGEGRVKSTWYLVLSPLLNQEQYLCWRVRIAGFRVSYDPSSLPFMLAVSGKLPKLNT
jgi:hypothetical protein